MKILLLDIETAPMMADVWKMWDENIGLNQIVQDWYILSWSAKWLDGGRMFYADQRAAASIENDRDILEQLWYLLDQADIVVAHNGDRFDIPKINARFVKAGLPPPSPYRQIDTLKIAKSRFKFTSNRLAYLGEFLGVETKKITHTKYPGHQLWIEVRKGNLSAWEEMKRYNKADVLALEGVYLKLRAWDKRHPNLAVDHAEDGVCPICGVAHSLEKRGYTYTNGGKYQRYHCTNESCGAWSRGKTNLLDKEERKALTVL